MIPPWRIFLVLSLSFIQFSQAKTIVTCPASEHSFLGAQKNPDSLVCFYGIGEVEQVLKDDYSSCEFPLRYRSSRALPWVRDLCLGAREICVLTCD